MRRAAVAGAFYPAHPERLRAQLRDLFPTDAVAAPAVGVVVPHAGYVYSGRVAAAVYGRVAPPETCVILGPNHTGLGAGVAIMSEGAWETPLGTVAIDQELAARIRSGSRLIVEDALGHGREHAIEVQLPFLQYLGALRGFVPLSLGRHDFVACAEVGRAVADAIRAAGRPALVVASTDMSHYVTRDEAIARDRAALDAMLALDAERLHAAVRREGISMCGYHAVAAALVAAAALGARRAELVMYTDSGAVTGETEQVVAYAGLTVG